MEQQVQDYRKIRKAQFRFKLCFSYFYTVGAL